MERMRRPEELPWLVTSPPPVHQTASVGSASSTCGRGGSDETDGGEFSNFGIGSQRTEMRASSSLMVDGEGRPDQTKRVRTRGGWKGVGEGEGQTRHSKSAECVAPNGSGDGSSTCNDREVAKARKCVGRKTAPTCTGERGRENHWHNQNIVDSGQTGTSYDNAAIPGNNEGVPEAEEMAVRDHDVQSGRAVVNDHSTRARRLEYALALACASNMKVRPGGPLAAVSAGGRGRVKTELDLDSGSIISGNSFSLGTGVRRRPPSISCGGGGLSEGGGASLRTGDQTHRRCSQRTVRAGNE